MKKKHYAQTVRVKSPCTQEWAEMSGNEQVRFCSHCAKDVNDLSAMTRKDAMRLVRRSNGELCVRYIENPVNGTPLFSDQLAQISRRAPRLAAGVMGASLSLSTLTYAQGGAERLPMPKTVQELTLVPLQSTVTKTDPRPTLPDENESKQPQAPTKGSGVVTGSVFDSNDAIIPGAVVALLGKNGDEIVSTTTGYDGSYKLEGIPFGTYQQAVSAPGFQQQLSQMRVADDQTQIENFKLSVQKRVVTMGGIAVVRTRGVSALMAAVHNDDLEKMRDLLARGENPDLQENDDDAPLFTAVDDGNLEMVRLLLEYRADVNIRNEEKETPLMMIDDDASLDLVRLMLDAEAKVNLRDENGDTVLIRAAGSVKPEVLRALLDAGAEINAQNDEGKSALMSAADEENLENVRMLLLSGADVNLRDKEGDNAWDYAAEDEVEALLVAHGAIVEDEEPDEPDDEGARELDVEIRSDEPEPVNQ